MSSIRVELVYDIKGHIQDLKDRHRDQTTYTWFRPEISQPLPLEHFNIARADGTGQINVFLQEKMDNSQPTISPEYIWPSSHFATEILHRQKSRRFPSQLIMPWKVSEFNGRRQECKKGMKTKERESQWKRLQFGSGDMLRILQSDGSPAFLSSNVVAHGQPHDVEN